MKRAYAAILLLIACAVAVSGCSTRAQDFKNTTLGGNFYNYDKVNHWMYNVTMSASGATSAWNMTVYVKNDTFGSAPARYMQILTEGNGMNITYDVWSDPKNYSVLKMHAKGTTGDYFQDKDVSTLQIGTLPDVGLSYYFVPFWAIKNGTATTASGTKIPVTVYSASDNKGLTVTYWICPYVPVPLKVEVSDSNVRIIETLIGYE